MGLAAPEKAPTTDTTTYESGVLLTYPPAASPPAEVQRRRTTSSPRWPGRVFVAEAIGWAVTHCPFRPRKSLPIRPGSMKRPLEQRQGTAKG